MDNEEIKLEEEIYTEDFYEGFEEWLKEKESEESD